MRKGGLRFKVEGKIKSLKENPEIISSIGKHYKVYEDYYDEYKKALDLVTEVKYLPNTFFKHFEDSNLKKDVRRIWKECYANVDEFAPYLDRNSIIYHTDTFHHFTHRLKVYLKQKIREAESGYYADVITYCYINDWEVTEYILRSEIIDPTREKAKRMLQYDCWIKKYNEWVRHLESTNTN